MKKLNKTIEKYIKHIYKEGREDKMYAPEIMQSTADFKSGFFAAQKEIKDKYNHLNSELKQLTTPKLDKRNNGEKIKELQIQVELLKQLLK